MKLIAIPDDGVITEFIYEGESVVGEKRIDLSYIPAADAIPVVHGQWLQVVCHEEFEDGFVDRLYECCSRCHEPNGRNTSNYCPNCGADMRGE